MRMIPIIFLIMSGCQAKSPDGNFPKYELRSNPEMLGDSVVFDNLSFRLPNAFNNIDINDLDRLKEKINNDQNSYFQFELINGFSDNNNSAILLSKINESDVISKLDSAYYDYLLSVVETNDIKETTFTLNGIKTIQYQINYEKMTNIKLFLFIIEQTYCVDYFINNNVFNEKLESIESSLSTLRIEGVLK